MPSPIRSRTGAAVAGLVLAALVGGGVGAATIAALGDDGSTGTTTIVQPAAASSSSKTSSQVAESAESVADIAKSSLPSVVDITVTTSGGSSQQGAPFGDQSARAEGSGWVYDDSNHVITNQHVVDGATSIKVTTSDGSSYDATVVGTDPSTDLAVIKVNAPAGKLQPLELGDSDALVVGDGVVAIGSPFGLEGTVTTGIVSALHREMQSPNGFTINDSIQTDAAINHGNSGGPLIDLSGRVIGVNAQIESDGGGSDGVGFAIPASTIRTVVPELISSGKVAHAYLGVQIQTIGTDVAKQLGEPAGAAVAKVTAGGPAAAAGLKAGPSTKTVDGVPYPTGGDVVTEFDGKAVTSSTDLQLAVDAHKPGDKVEMTVVNGGQTRTVTVTLGTRPASTS
jgi:putative serine protease PepD